MITLRCKELSLLDSNLTTDSIFTNTFFFIFYGIFSRAIIRLHISKLCALKPWSRGKNVACLISTFIYGEYVNSKFQKMLWIFFYNWLFSQMTFSVKKFNFLMQLTFTWLASNVKSIVKKNIHKIFWHNSLLHDSAPNLGIEGKLNKAS